MVELELHLTIKRPVGAVFRYVSNVENLPKWAEVAHHARQVTNGPVRVGTQAEVDVEFHGHHVRAIYEVTEFEEGRLFAFRTSNAPFNLRNVYRFTPVDGTTRLDVTSVGEGHGLSRFLVSFAARLLDRQFTRDHERLRTMLERGEDVERVG